MQVEWAPDRFVTTTLAPADGPVGMVLAHGAGTDQHHRMVVALRDGLAAAGVPVLTFDYPYRAEGRGRPDRPEALLACHRAVIERATEVFGGPPVLGGRSMGGRIGTMVAAEGSPDVRGVVAYAYPLHPLGKPDRLRVAHLADIEVPVLMVIGDRDTMCTPELYDRHVRHVPNVTTYVLAGADHSWRVLKSSGRTTDDVNAEAIAATVDWLGSLPA